jgi:hypothetical protein
MKEEEEKEEKKREIFSVPFKSDQDRQSGWAVSINKF